VVVKGRRNPHGTCGGKKGIPARVTIFATELEDSAKLLQQKREWHHFCEL